MLKASLLSLTVLVALTAVPPAHARHADEWSSAKHTTHHRVRHRAAQPGYGYGQPGYRQPGYASQPSGRQQGQDVCRGDAIRAGKVPFPETFAAGDRTPFASPIAHSASPDSRGRCSRA